MIWLWYIIPIFTSSRHIHNVRETEKVNTTTEFFIFEIVYVLNFSLNWQFWFFGLNLPKKGICSLNQKKWTPLLNSTYLNSTVYEPNLRLDLQFWFFGPNFPKKSIPSQKQKKWTWSEFCIFDLVQVPNFSLNWWFWFFGLNLSKKDISNLRQKNCTFLCIHGRYLLY